MTRKVVVVLNAGSGAGGNDATLADRIGTLFELAGARAEVRLAHGHELAAVVEAALASAPDVIVAGGGDGTVSSVGAALAGRPIALGVLPLGTLNHFAKDMRLPLDLEGAVARIATGPLVQVDVGEVNGRIFVNNSSLGLYPDIVRDRERQQKRLGRGKWPALRGASLVALRRFAFMSVRLSVDGRERHRRTPFVFIGNNAYQMEGFAIGERRAPRRRVPQPLRRPSCRAPAPPAARAARARRPAPAGARLRRHTGQPRSSSRAGTGACASRPTARSPS